MVQRFIIVIGIFAAGYLCGCVSSEITPGNPARDNVIVKEQYAINMAFNKICNLMQNGELKTVYDKYLSKFFKTQQSYEEFAQNYETNKKSLVEAFNGAALKHISPEEKKASTIVTWGNGESSLLEFSKEDDTWKINYLRPPARVIEGGTEMPPPSGGH